MKKVLLAIWFAFAFLLAGCSNYSAPDTMVNETIKTNLSQERFHKVYVDGTLSVLIDKETRVQYIIIDERFYGFRAMSMAPLINQDGKPILYVGPLE